MRFTIPRPRTVTAIFFGLVVALALVIIWKYDPPQRNMDGDASFMLYAGQQILRGNAPYKTVGIVKLPFSPILAATGIAAGRAFGLADVLGGRYIFVLCAALAAGATFLVGKQLGGIEFGVLSALALLGLQTFGIHAARGPEPKMALVTAGMLCVWFLAKRKWFAAGIAAACAFLTWQPGLIFVACAFLAPLLETRAKRRRGLAWSSAGILLPLLLVGIYLFANEALTPMWNQTIGANANYFQERKAAAGLWNVVTSNVTRLWTVTNSCATTEPALLFLGWLGLFGSGAFVLWRAGRMILRARTQSLHDSQKQFLLNTLPLLITGGALFGFSLLDVQSCMDFVPLMPYFALGAGLVLFCVVRLLAALAAQRNVFPKTRAVIFSSVVLALALLVYGTRDVWTLPRQIGLPRQIQLAQNLARPLSPDDKVQQFGDAAFFVLTGRQNATPFLHLGEKQGRGILQAEGMTIQDLNAELETLQPRLVLISRGRAKGWAKPLFNWLGEHYTLDGSYKKNQGSARTKTDVWRRVE